MNSTGSNRIIFINRFYWPDEAATAQLLTDLAEGLAARGHRISVIASHDGNPETPRREIHCGVEVIRVSATRWGGRQLAGKVADYATFAMAIRRTLWAEARAGDCIVAMTDPPALSLITAAAARRVGASTIHWLQDIHPEISLALAPSRLMACVFYPWIRQRNAAWRAAKACVAISSDIAALLRDSGVPAGAVRVIPNWAPGRDTLIPVAHGQNILRKQWGLEGKFVVTYSGNLGRVHSFGPILTAAAALQDEPGFTFLFVGAGPQRIAIERQVRLEGLTNVRFQPAQPLARLAESLSAADVHLVTLRPGCERLVFPSKLYGIAAVARPLVYIGPPQCELARTIQDGGFGIAVPTGDAGSLGGVLRSLRADPARRAAMGNAAARWARETCGAAAAIARWEDLLGQIRGHRSSTVP